MVGNKFLMFMINNLIKLQQLFKEVNFFGLEK